MDDNYLIFSAMQCRPTICGANIRADLWVSVQLLAFNSHNYVSHLFYSG